MRKRSLARWLLALGVGTTLGACNEKGIGAAEEGGEDNNSADTGSTGDDGNGFQTNGQDPDDGADEMGDSDDDVLVEWSFEPIFGVPNIDNDDEDDRSDWLQIIFDGEDDHSTLTVPALPEGHQALLRVTGDVEWIRAWNDNSVALGSGANEVLDTYQFRPGAEGTTLNIEFGADNVEGALTLLHLDADGQEVQRAEIELRSSPLILNHHLQPAEHLWVVSVQAGYGNNDDMVAEFQQVLGERFSPVVGAQYGFDVWIQDELQFAASLGDEGQRIDTVIDSIRDRALDTFPENELLEPGVNIRTWGNPAQVTTWDSFGNLENSPPVAVDGVEYPFGRIYYGKSGNLGLHNELAEFLQSQTIQAPIEMDTFWLCVGHVDEFATFVPDPSSDKGFKLLISDVPAAYAILETLDPAMSLTRYGPDHGYDTVGTVLNDTALRNLNEELQADELDPIREQFIAELGLDEDDIVRMPSLFETISGCGGGVAALIPGMVNLIVANPEDGPINLMIPDPYFRTDEDDESTDPVIEYFTANLPDGVVPHYVDNWDVYHLALGEVHCGTNVRRTPIERWWEVGLHLLGGE